ncbi:HAMP domain-containing sensor histidine kinase [Variovorax sp. J22G21]|uniref:sensor histidine kinase n=1 Tax=Variovorax fucosicus TaxID=3053517 RepID=UPI002576EB2B|nr:MULTISPECIES: HAMP domain-containing sensor histidine kinase [unclassified Variovorax]MDM0041646.1 HAMP domain-containing sensor histidine kinase [Variovorax sp. J22R193]MDM0060702.1 HAMP domain-containing sensor histidine kinase [Variovorax sp. J22G21]
MRPSETLAGRLTRTLVLWIGGVWLLCVLAVVWYVDREINFNFDNELVEVSHRMFDIAVDEVDRRQSELPAGRPLIAPTPLFNDAAVIYQVVDGNERVLLRSAETPPNTFDVPVSPGFANLEAWRIYTVRHPSRPLFLQVADPLSERRNTLNRTLFGLLLPLVAVLPLLAFLLRRIARGELHVLRELASEIGRRSGTDLRPIQLPGLPRELALVGDHVNRLLERLAQSLDVERALAANAAHELRTPLAAARLRLQTALDHDLRRSDVEAALTALQTLSHRAEKLLQLSRAESGASLARTRVDLVQLAATVAEEFWQEARAIDRLDLKVPETEPAPVAMGDFDALAIALRNLVENGLRYARDSRVELEVTADCRLVVRDFGPGVTEAELRTLQLRHVRHTDGRTGYGLGLSIVSTIVTKHGARLELASPPPGAPSGFEARIVLRPA